MRSSCRVTEIGGLTLTTMVVGRFERDGLQLHRGRADTVCYGIQDRLDGKDLTKGTCAQSKDLKDLEDVNARPKV